MTIFFPILLIIVCLLSLPAYLMSKKRGMSESKWLIFSSIPAIALWFLLIASGYGAQSLSNIIEVIYLAGASVLLSYVKVTIIDRKIRKPILTTYGIIVILTIGAVLLRTFMPSLPE